MLAGIPASRNHLARRGESVCRVPSGGVAPDHHGGTATARRPAADERPGHRGCAVTASRPTTHGHSAQEVRHAAPAAGSSN